MDGRKPVRYLFRLGVVFFVSLALSDAFLYRWALSRRSLGKLNTVVRLELAGTIPDLVGLIAGFFNASAISVRQSVQSSEAKLVKAELRF